MQFRLFMLIFVVISIECQNLTRREIEEKNDCKCVRYYNCDKDNFINTNGEGLIEERTQVPRIVCPDIEKNISWCCKLRTAKPRNPSENLEVEREKEKKINEIFTERVNVTCGKQRPAINIRVLQGSSVLPGEFPWMAAIFKNSKFLCSGTLIHPKVVMTVTHYVRRVTSANLKVVVNGKTELDADSQDAVGVQEIIKHPEYYAGGFHNDIALLILNKELDISEDGNPINNICLPPHSYDFNGSSCLVAAWNKNDAVLKKVSLPIIQRNKCQKWLRNEEKTGLPRSFELHESFVCAGGIKGEDACKGDGGAPLMCPIDDTYYQIGIVSWGKCGIENVPGLYTDVAKFKPWIMEEMEKRQLSL